MESISVFWCLLGGLILVSGFFSSAETGMMSLNRYRLRHRVQEGDVKAKRIAFLLNRPDRLLGIILLGNTFANVCASAVATVLAQYYLGDVGILIGSVMMTVVVLIFAETAPKTFAALNPERVSDAYSLIMIGLLKVFYPLVWAVNLVANGVLFLFGVKKLKMKSDVLSIEEIKTLLNQVSGKVRKNYQGMLLRVLELEKVAIEHVMIPKSAITALNLEQSWEEVCATIFNCPFSYVPIYSGDFNKVEKALNIKKALSHIAMGKVFDVKSLSLLADDLPFVPCEAEVSRQLNFFQKKKYKMAIVVDEYGSFLGLVTLQDMVDEILADFVSDVSNVGGGYQKQSNGSVVVPGNINLLDLDRLLGADFSTSSAVTLSGLIIEHLEMIPRSPICLVMGGYRIEVLDVSKNMILLARLSPVCN
jgi:Mg2+/Co2+ transporter CorB